MKPPTVILAGGRSSRMGAEKALLPLNGRPLLAHVVGVLRPQCSDILINANSDPARFDAFDLPVLPDPIPGLQGPLAGLLTGMTWALQHNPDAPHLLTTPCDTPFLPTDLVVRLQRMLAETGSDIAVARDAQRLHPAIGLWPVRLAPLLAEHLESSVSRSIHGWLEKFHVCAATFEADALCNLNTPHDRNEAETRFAKPIAEPEI